MIQDGPMPTGADKPLRISGDPYKVQVHTHGVSSSAPGSLWLSRVWTSLDQSGPIRANQEQAYATMPSSVQNPPPGTCGGLQRLL